MARTNIILLLVISAHAAVSQNCCSGGVPISSNIGVAPASKNTLQTIVIGDLNYLNRLLRGTQKVRNESRERKTTSLLFLINYTFSDRFSADLTLPWVSQLRRNEGINNAVFTEKTSGLGDISLLLKYQLTNPGITKSSLSLGAGIKMPTGNTTQTDSDGIILSLDMQPGTGSTDQFLWAFYANHITNSLMLTASSLFQFTGSYDDYNGSQSYKTGNSMVARVGLTKDLILSDKIISPSIEAIPRKNWMDSVDGQLIPNTGGHWIFARPSININFSQRLILNLGAEVPVYSNVIGEQLSSSVRTTFQFIHRLNLKQGLN